VEADYTRGLLPAHLVEQLVRRRACRTYAEWRWKHARCGALLPDGAVLIPLAEMLYVNRVRRAKEALHQPKPRYECCCMYSGAVGR